MATLRKPFQGIKNVIRFNWHFYVFAMGFLALLFFFSFQLRSPFNIFALVVAALLIITTSISLLVSFYVYDRSELYTLSWLEEYNLSSYSEIVNIHAGFDETSELLQTKFKTSHLQVFDFYDPVKHTEISIKRARKAYPPFPNTKQISTDVLPLADDSIDVVFLILTAHEIRNETERILFFKELNRVLKSKGKIIVTEHLRDPANFFAYTIGFFHFHSRKTWNRTFREAGFSVKMELKITPFISTFMLEKNGNTS
jgi:SAM-dependent methyltransferase